MHLVRSFLGHLDRHVTDTLAVAEMPHVRRVLRDVEDIAGGRLKHLAAPNRTARRLPWSGLLPIEQLASDLKSPAALLHDEDIGIVFVKLRECLVSTGQDDTVRRRR